MPEYQPPHVDKKETIPEHHRLKMLELAIEGIDGLVIETIELERKGISYTYDTMKILTEKNPDTDYYFIIGADMVDYLPKWYRIDELVDMVQFVGVQRPRYKVGPSYPVIWVDVPLMDISSSMVRDFIAQGRKPNFLLPQPVLDYIEKEGLY
ncbi:nicotinate (nicotinamide) nucleotide adenylyltransferase [Streptococcus pneumoniae SP3-BS71]|nr:nicotinate (nicotinamide) nucleotide adenylyltransferase [Streptococcus pneumoniae SP3-BS71]